MSLAARPRRSVLYMPGAKARALEKARTLPCDGIIMDLEDATGIAEKSEARRLVCEAVRAGGYGQREIAIRINGLDTDWGIADLEAAAAAGPDAILIPKVESASMIRDVEERMAAAGAPETTRLWAMMETPMGMLRAAEIAASSPRLAVLVMGTNDLVKDLRAQHTEMRLPVITGLGLCLLAARAHGLAVLDGVWNALKDETGLRAQCVQGRELGMDGKTLIHPDQIAITNDVFSPTEAELALARRYVEAFAEAEALGRGVAVVDGRLVENLHVEQGRRLIAMAEAIAAMEAAAT